MGLESEEIESLRRFFPTMRQVHAPEEVRQEEWDVLVVKGKVSVRVHSDLYVLSFGASLVEGMERPRVGKNIRAASVGYGGPDRGSLAMEFLIPDDLNSDVARLVLRDVIPKLRAEKVHSCIGLNYVWGVGASVVESAG
jgi:hypothetical protein